IRKFCGSPGTRDEFLSARIGGQCPRILRASRLVPEALVSSCYAKQFLSQPRSKSLFSFGVRARPGNGKADSCGFRYENFPHICPPTHVFLVLKTNFLTNVRVMPGAPNTVEQRSQTPKSNSVV